MAATDRIGHIIGRDSWLKEPCSRCSSLWVVKASVSQFYLTLAIYESLYGFNNDDLKLKLWF